MISKEKQKIFYARDLLFYFNKGFDTFNEAEAYVTRWGGFGFVEEFELNGNYYYFKEATPVGKTQKGQDRGPVFGDKLPEGKVYKKIAYMILG